MTQIKSTKSTVRIRRDSFIGSATEQLSGNRVLAGQDCNSGIMVTGTCRSGGIYLYDGILEQSLFLAKYLHDFEEKNASAEEIYQILLF